MKQSHLFVKQIYFIFTFSLLTLLFTQCKKDADDPVIIEDPDIAIVNNDLIQLNDRVRFIGEPVFSTVTSKSDDNDYTWYYVAEVEAPTFNGEILSATHVDIIDNKAYVAYNRQGDIYMGGVEVIDLDNPAFPSIITQMLFTGNDVNAVAADADGSNASRQVYLAMSSFKKGAVLRQLTTQNGQFNGELVDLSLSKSLQGDVISASANGIACTQDYIYVSSGKSYGGTFQVLKSDLTVINNEEYSAAKYVAVNGSQTGDQQITLTTGDNSYLHIYEVGPNRDDQVFDIGAIFHQNVEEPYYGKSAMHIDEGSNNCFVSLGLNGMKAYDILSGDVVYESPSGMLTTGNTNGLTKDDLFVYLANGADGLFIGKMPTGGGELIPVQVWDMDETGASANLVKASNDWLFVAKGGGGFKILRRIQNVVYPPVCDYDSIGVPICIEPYDVCDLLHGHLDLTLPERVNAFENHPEYFINDNHEIELDEAAQLSMVFITEGAGFQNTVGYYHYPTNNPPLSAEDLNTSMHIVFPNASEEFSGGNLHAGDMVTIPNEFPAGTTVGFFMLANAWNDGAITEGLYQHYTRTEFNYQGMQQHLMMYDSICGCVVVGIEDVLSDRGDKDFNDIVFQVVIEPETAFNHDRIVQIPPQ
ncbi:MAG: DUF4114 domain-containing protein [Bacteroidales bacterium]|nr:DUF4114 domain-containing protein [Bacteroidales bacterium]